MPSVIFSYNKVASFKKLKQNSNLFKGFLVEHPFHFTFIRPLPLHDIVFKTILSR